MKVNLRDLTYVETYGRCARYHFMDKTHLDTISLRTSFEKEIDPLQKNRFYLMANLSIFLNLRISNCVKRGQIVIYLIKNKKREILF